MKLGGGLPLGPGKEFDLIRTLLPEAGPSSPRVLLGPGDDCAVLEGGVVLSVDLSVEGIHFRRDWLSLEEAGYRAAAGALSDLAAMAAEPVGVLLSMGLASEEAEAVSMALQNGAREACRREGVQIIGGDLSRSPGPVFLDVVVVGRTDKPLLRGGSSPGDEVWVTGWLGGSAAALHLLMRGQEAPASLRQRLARPRPRIREMRWLGERAELTSAIDLSDGLAGDAGHLAAASGKELILEAEAIPLAPDLEAIFPDPARRLHFGLRGGEDYEVCVTARPGMLEALREEFQGIFGIPLTRIGGVTEGTGLRFRDAEGALYDPGGGFDHFFNGEKE